MFIWIQPTSNTSHSISEPSSSSSLPSVHNPSFKNDEITPNSSPDSISDPLPSIMMDPMITVPAILHLIGDRDSVEIASGDFSLLLLEENDKVVPEPAGNFRWPLSKESFTEKVDDSHYRFSDGGPIYEFTIVVSKGQNELLEKLDEILGQYSNFSVKYSESVGSAAEEVSPEGLKSEKKKKRCAKYSTELAPEVENYSGATAKLIAASSGQVVKGILWCGDATGSALEYGNEVLKTKINPGSHLEISEKTLKNIARVKKGTEKVEKVANKVVSGAAKVGEFLTGRFVNSKAGKKLGGCIPREIILASLDGFSKTCDAVKVVGNDVMSTSSTATTELISHRYGAEAAKATSEGLCCRDCMGLF